jgi:hypothetical protein
LNWDIVDAMFTVKELMLSPAGTVAEPPVVADAEVEADAEAEAEGDVVGVVVAGELDDEQPAAVRATSAAAIPTQPSRPRPRAARSPCEWEDRPPSVLKPSPIPNIPSLERARMSRCGTPYSSRIPSTRKHAPRPDLGVHRGGRGQLAQPGTLISPTRNTTVYFAQSLVPTAGGYETRSV